MDHVIHQLAGAVRQGFMHPVTAAAVARAEAVLELPWPDEVRRCLLCGGGDIWNLFGMSMTHCVHACAPPGPWLWDDGPVRFDTVDAARAAAVARGGSPAANVFQGAVLLGEVPGPVGSHTAVLVPHGANRGEVWILSNPAGTGAAVEQVSIAPLFYSVLGAVVPNVGTSLSSLVAFACGVRALADVEADGNVLREDADEGDAEDKPIARVPEAHPGVRAADAVFEPLTCWGGGPCPAVAAHEALAGPGFCLPSNPSRPCDGVLVSGLPGCGEAFWDTVCALDIGLVVTLLPLPLTWAGPAASLPGVPTPTLPAAYQCHDVYHSLDTLPVDVTPDEVVAVQYAVNFRVDRSVPTACSDVVRRRDPLRFAKALHAAATVRGVVFLHLPTPDGHVLHRAYADAVVHAAQAAWTRGTRVWVHCWAGVYRSYLTALLVMQRCVPRNSHLPLLDPRRVEAKLFTDFTGPEDGRPSRSGRSGRVGRAGRAPIRTAVRWAHLNAIEAAAAAHCRCVPELHYTWLVLGHPRLASMAFCLEDQDPASVAAVLTHAGSWVAALDAEADTKLRIAFDLSDLEGPCTAEWAWIRHAVAVTVANLQW
jgi:hypothetical protein